MCLPTEAGAHPWRECKNLSCSTLRLVAFNVKYKVPLNKCGFYSKTGSSLVLHNHLQHSTVGSEHTITRREDVWRSGLCHHTALKVNTDSEFQCILLQYQCQGCSTEQKKLFQCPTPYLHRLCVQWVICKPGLSCGEEQEHTRCLGCFYIQESQETNAGISQLIRSFCSNFQN